MSMSSVCQVQGHKVRRGQKVSTYSYSDPFTINLFKVKDFSLNVSDIELMRAV